MKRNRITKNIGLKIISLLFAIGVWLVVVNIDDPSISASFYNIPVTIQNADVISAQGKMYEVLDDTDTVPRVTVYGPRSILENLDKSDIVATADMNNLSSVDTVSITYSTTSSNSNSQISDIKGSIESLKVSIENKKSIQLVLSTSLTGSAPDGYTVGGVSTDQNLVRVTGPESVVDEIEKAVVNVDMDTLSGVTSDITTSATVHLYDAEDNEVTGSTLTKNPESVIVTVSILPTKEVPLVFTTSGVPADGYALASGEDSIVSDPATVTLAGTSSVLAGITEIDIPSEELNITGQSSNMTADVDISDYLPDGASLVDSSQSEVSVEVEIERLVTRTFTIDAGDIGVTNMPENETCVLDNLSDQFEVSVTGVQSAVGDVTASSLVQDFDVTAWMSDQELTELPAGSYDVTLGFNLPDGVTVDNPITATLVVTENGDTEASQTSSSATTNTTAEDSDTN